MVQDILERLATRFGIFRVNHQRKDQIFLSVASSDSLSTIRFLKENEGFVHLSFFTAVDRIEDGVFELKYMLRNHDLKLDICVGVDVERDGKDGEHPRVDSIHALWPAAITYEQELAEMYGIDFPGSPRVGKSFILEGWNDMPPMRRDFDTRKYSEETYFARPGRETHDPAEHMRKELYPSEAEKW